MTYTVYVKDNNTGEENPVTVVAENFDVCRNFSEHKQTLGVQFYNKLSPYVQQNVAYFPGDVRVVAVQEAS